MLGPATRSIDIPVRPVGPGALHLRRGHRRHGTLLGSVDSSSDGCPTPPGRIEDVIVNLSLQTGSDPGMALVLQGVAHYVDNDAYLTVR